MKFYIVTPVLNSLGWLQRCVYSVADQVREGVEVHHHVQDGGSGDGTVRWLEEWYRGHAHGAGYSFSYASASDAGMYDAINKAWARVPQGADVVAHLNADEQYLTGALGRVAAAFDEHPEAEILLGSFVVVDACGNYICHRRSAQPVRWRSQTVCELTTCTTFHRAEAFICHGVRYDTAYRALADVVFHRDLVNRGVRIVTLPEMLTSVFAVTGTNLGWTEISQREWEAELARLPWYVSRRHGVAQACNNLLRRVADWRCEPPQEYAIYMPGGGQRQVKKIRKPTAHWGKRSVSPDSE